MSARKRISRPARNQAAPFRSTAADGTNSSRSPVQNAFVVGAPLMAGATVLIHFIDGEPVITAEAGALLFGIPADEITAGMTEGMANGTEPFPPEWLRAGESRAAEALAATGDSTVLAGLTYWAIRDLGVELTFEDVE